MAEPLYLSYSRYLRQRYGATVYRVAVDAGFSCPNRAGGRASNGCTYCAEDGARAPYLGRLSGGSSQADCASMEDGLKGQVAGAIAFLGRRYGADAFILYFQAYSNTNAPVETLRRLYDAGLSLAAFRGLNVATRPDCIDERKADLLASYRERGIEVWAEVGLQTANDETLARVRRGHTLRDFIRAFGLLRGRGIKVAVHLIFGLPGEGRSQILRTIETLSRLDPDG